jgi:hypothetical protein
MRRYRSGFSMIEIVIMVIAFSVMATILLVGYGTWQRGMAIASVQNDVKQGVAGLGNFKNFNNGYPPNLAGIDFKSSPNVALALWTNASGIPVYTNLTPDQNVALLLFACNAYMPVTDGSTVYNTACEVAGQNLHVSGQKSSNIVFKGPTITQADLKLTCGAVCDTATQNIITIFQQQGGTWPLTVTGTSVSLPAPTNFNATGNATAFCLQGTSPVYSDIVFHATNTDDHIQNGPCPSNPSLHYP